MNAKLKRISKIIWKTILGLLAFLLLYVIVGVLLSVLGTHPPKVDCNQRTEIFLTTNGIHLDFIIPIKSLDRTLFNNLQLPTSTQYVAFGWGDRGFYLETPTWDDLKFSTVAKAMFLKSKSVMHVTQYRYPSNAWEKMYLCPQQLESLLHYITTSFKTESSHQFIEIKDAGYTNRDQFYEANGSYSLFKTCNNWVNIGLKEARVETALWSPFDFGVLYHLPDK